MIVGQLIVDSSFLYQKLLCIQCNIYPADTFSYALTEVICTIIIYRKFVGYLARLCTKT